MRTRVKMRRAQRPKSWMTNSLRMRKTQTRRTKMLLLRARCLWRRKRRKRRAKRCLVICVMMHHEVCMRLTVNAMRGG